jgi:hypothetical protein|eukprot:Stramenopile-MAST_4_protein_3346
MSFTVGLDHGVDVANPWFVGVPLAFITLVALFRALGLWSQQSTKPGKHPEKNSRLSDMVAYMIVSGTICTYVGVYGTIAFWRLNGNEVRAQLEVDEHSAFYGRSEYVENYLIYPMLGYQFWNTVLCFIMNDLKDPAMVGHHVFTGTLAYFGLYPYLHLKGLFFFGFAEMTNTVLTIYDLFKMFPEQKKKYTFLFNLAQYGFGISFIVIRLGMWPLISYEFWKGSISLLQTGKAHSSLVVITFLVANIFLTGLQFLWGSKIFGMLLKKKKSNEEPKKQD